jgi:hypothetical protein
VLLTNLATLFIFKKNFCSYECFLRFFFAWDGAGAFVDALGSTPIAW